MRYKVVVWGFGKAYRQVANNLLGAVEKGRIELVGYIADSLPPTGYVDGAPILHKADLRDLDYDLLILCGFDDTYVDMLRIAVDELDVPRAKTLRGDVLSVPDFDFQEYMELRQSRVSIISNLCRGGFLCKSLDMECLSPFRNLYVGEPSYLRLLGDLRHYCTEYEPVFSHEDVDAIGARHPVMNLGDVRLHFNHAADADEALCEWNKRVGRINWDNLFVMAKVDTKEDELRFHELDLPVKKICFVPHETDLPHSMYLPTVPPGTPFFDVVNRTSYPWTHSLAFYPIKLLLGKDGFRRYRP